MKVVEGWKKKKGKRNELSSCVFLVSVVFDLFLILANTARCRSFFVARDGLRSAEKIRISLPLGSPRGTIRIESGGW